MRPHREEFERLGARVLLISFGTPEWAHLWLEETGSPFPLLLDSDRTVYRRYGLERSALRVWSPRVIWYYLRLLWAGRRLKPVQGDPHQLGGDFIVDRERVVRCAHPSRDPADRPSPEELLDVLRRTATERKAQEKPPTPSQAPAPTDHAKTPDRGGRTTHN